MLSVPDTYREKLEEIRSMATEDNLGDIETAVTDMIGPIRTVRSAKVDEGPIKINDATFDPGPALIDKYDLTIKGNRAYVKIHGKNENKATYCSVEIPKNSAIRHFHVHGSKPKGGGPPTVTALAFYASEEGSTECIRCGNTIVCGVNPSCGPVPPDL